MGTRCAAAAAQKLVAAKGGTLAIPRGGHKSPEHKAAPEGQPAVEEEEGDGGFRCALAATMKHISASPEYCHAMVDHVLLLPASVGWGLLQGACGAHGTMPWCAPLTQAASGPE